MKEQDIIKYMTEKHYRADEYVCWDFVRDIYKDIYNIILPEYPANEVQAEFKYKLKGNIPHSIINSSNAKESDIIVFSLFAAQHAGVLIDNENFIHLSKDGVQVSNIKEVGGNYVIYRIIE